MSSPICIFFYFINSCMIISSRYVCGIIARVTLHSASLIHHVLFSYSWVKLCKMIFPYTKMSYYLQIWLYMVITQQKRLLNWDSNIIYCVDTNAAGITRYVCLVSPHHHCFSICSVMFGIFRQDFEIPSGRWIIFFSDM